MGTAAGPRAPPSGSRQAPRTPGAHPSGLWPLDLPPPFRRPPAGPRRRLPYLRSPGPPFYFLKPSHKAPRWPPLACFLPETLARAHFPSRLRERRAARACAPSLARSRAPRCCHRQARFRALAGALTAPASFSRRSRGRGQGRAHAQCATRAFGTWENTRSVKGARLALGLDAPGYCLFSRGSQWWESEPSRAPRWKPSSR